MAAEYSYIPVGNRHFCIDGSLMVLGWILALNNRRLHLDALGVPRRQVPRILKTLFRRRRMQHSAEDTLVLPVFGHLGLRVHKGYKLFDLATGKTTKIFDADVDPAARAHEIAVVREAALLDFAPDLIAVDADNRWYTERYISGTRSLKSDPADAAELFRKVIVGHLGRMLLLRPLDSVNAGTYLDELLQALQQEIARPCFDGIRQSIEDFIRTIAGHIKTLDAGPLYRTLSHGDFAFVNFIYNDSGVVVIDWESLQLRSPLNDFHNYFLTETYYGRNRSSPVTDIDAALPLLCRRLAPQAPELADDLIKRKNLYRWFYYLERMHMLVCRDMSDNQLNVIRRSMDIFNDYESATLGSAS